MYQTKQQHTSAYRLISHQIFPNVPLRSIHALIRSLSLSTRTESDEKRSNGIRMRNSVCEAK